MTIGIDTTFLVQHDVKEAPYHEWARVYLAKSVFEKGHVPGLCPQVLSEYLHIITDHQRFENPLDVGEVLARTAAWWSLPGMRGVFPLQRSFALFLEWMGMHDRQERVRPLRRNYRPAAAGGGRNFSISRLIAS